MASSGEADVLGMGAAAGSEGQQSQLLKAGDRWRFTGDRGDFAVLTGHVGKDVLAWLQEGLAEVSREDWSFEPPEGGHPSWKFEKGNKMEMIGHLFGPNRLKKTLFSLDAGTPHYRRWRAWRAAFMKKNEATLKAGESAI